MVDKLKRMKDDLEKMKDDLEKMKDDISAAEKTYIQQKNIFLKYGLEEEMIES